MECNMQCYLKPDCTLVMYSCLLTSNSITRIISVLFYKLHHTHRSHKCKHWINGSCHVNRLVYVVSLTVRSVLVMKIEEHFKTLLNTNKWQQDMHFRYIYICMTTRAQLWWISQNWRIVGSEQRDKQNDVLYQIHLINARTITPNVYTLIIIIIIIDYKFDLIWCIRVCVLFSFRASTNEKRIWLKQKFQINYYLYHIPT